MGSSEPTVELMLPKNGLKREFIIIHVFTFVMGYTKVYFKEKLEDFFCFLGVAMLNHSNRAPLMMSFVTPELKPAHLAAHRTGPVALVCRFGKATDTIL